MPTETSPTRSVTWNVPYIKPRFPSAHEIAEDVESIVASNWYTNFGPLERRFSASLSSYLDDRPVATASSATVGLMAALSILVPPASATSATTHVLVASFTFAAGPAAIRWSGHEPLFIDVDPVTMQPSLASARTALSASGAAVAGILLTNTFGIGTPEIAEWEALAAEYGLPLIVDSAAGFGSEYPDGRKVGTAGDCEVFSFHATKPFAIGEGGCIAWRDQAHAVMAESFFNFGFVRHEAVMVGLNGKLQELNAAIGLRQMARWDTSLASRRTAFGQLKAALEPLGLRLPDGQDRSSVCAAFALAPTPAVRDTLLDAFHHAGVEARVYYAPPVHLQAAFAEAPTADDLPGTRDLCSRVLAIPVHEEMADAAITTIVAAAQQALRPQ